MLLLMELENLHPGHTYKSAGEIAFFLTGHWVG